MGHRRITSEQKTAETPGCARCRGRGSGRKQGSRLLPRLRASARSVRLLRTFRRMVREAASAKDMRDTALLLAGLAGGFRHAEFDADVCGHRARAPGEGGQQTPVQDRPGGSWTEGRHPPARSGGPWPPSTTRLPLTGMKLGAAFHLVDRHGRVSAEPLSREAVSLIVREQMAAVGFDRRGCMAFRPAEKGSTRPAGCSFPRVGASARSVRLLRVFTSMVREAASARTSATGFRRRVHARGVSRHDVELSPQIAATRSVN